MTSESDCFWRGFTLAQQGPEEEKLQREEKWMWRLVQHTKGVRHRMDSKATDAFVERFDPVGLAFRNVSIKSEYKPLNDTEVQQYEDFLCQVVRGELESVKAGLDNVRAMRAPALDPTQTVAALGARQGHADIVQFAVEKGAVFDRSLCLALRKWGSKSPELQKIADHHEEEIVEILDNEPTPPHRQGPRPTGHEFDDVGGRG